MKQTAEEKAKELFNNFIAPTQQWDDVDGYITDEYNAKQCASITVNEIIENLVELFERSKTKKRNNMEQTAVDWLKKRIRAELTYEQDVLFEELFDQAKEMEKEQIVNAYNDCEWTGDHEDGEQYYKETYENNN